MRKTRLTPIINNLLWAQVAVQSQEVNGGWML